MVASKSIEKRIKQIKGLHARLGLDTKIEDVKPSEYVERLFRDDEVLSGLERATKRVRPEVHEIKIGILMAFLSQVERYGFLSRDINYADWCSGRGELAYVITHFVGAESVRVDKNFPRKNIIEECFPCTRQYQIPKIQLDLTAVDYDGNVLQIQKNPSGKVAYLGTHCCGSLADLVVKYLDLQTEKPDFIGIVPCHHEKMDFELSTKASKLKLSEDIFAVLKRAIADLQRTDGYHNVARRAMEMIDHYRAENLKLLGYDAKVVRLYPPSVSPFNHMIIGIRR